MARRGLAFLLVFACALSCVLCLPGAGVAAGFARVAHGRAAALGIGAGLLNMALFHAISPSFQSDAAGTATMGGAWYGLGCLTATLLVAVTLLMAGTSYVPASWHLWPWFPRFLRDLRQKLLYGPFGKRSAHTAAGAEGFPQPRRRDVRGAAVLSVRQRMSIAGWLPIFLIRRVGLSPEAALIILALYWLFLLTGRVGSVAILPRVRHGHLLLGSVLVRCSAASSCFSRTTPSAPHPAHSSWVPATPASIPW